MLKFSVVNLPRASCNFHVRFNILLKPKSIKDLTYTSDVTVQNHI